MAATLLQREPGGAWMATAHLGGSLALPGVGVPLPMAEIYQGLVFPGLADAR